MFNAICNISGGMAIDARLQGEYGDGFPPCFDKVVCINPAILKVAAGREKAFKKQFAGGYNRVAA